MDGVRRMIGIAAKQEAANGTEDSIVKLRTTKPEATTAAPPRPHRDSAGEVCHVRVLPFPGECPSTAGGAICW
jgi:hypothetical protein